MSEERRAPTSTPRKRSGGRRNSQRQSGELLTPASPSEVSEVRRSTRSRSDVAPVPPEAVGTRSSRKASIIESAGASTSRADREHQQNVVAAATARPRPQPEPRADGMPRRRVNRSMHAQRRAQRMEEEREAMVEEEHEEDEEESPAAPTGKIGAKKQKKLEEKQARKAQREAEEAEREERKKQEMKREEERRKDEERIRQEEEREEEEKKKAKEEQEKREHEEYLKLKESFTVEEEGVAETMDEEQTRSFLTEFINYIKTSKVVILEDLGAHFGLRAQDAISRIQDLLADGSITGVIDDRGKFIYITEEEMAAVAQFIRQRGRVSISELAQATNKLINLNPESISAPLSVS